ncbi:DUF2284 domain-containing protein [Crassaminicella profunda]|uniref:DUF2284 domain-containing protein n=1 Tax=Crassaminicella profunda TaxID=1286698 RepID=UPI001CA5FD58|nr:DUF2284 domain-containing protein [Crassaminicella profunda]QZY54823.1 DUF2284 domain-containing protein [Crassaminicella profunda]
MDKLKQLKAYIDNQDIYLMKEIPPEELPISKEVRDTCMKNKCGQYNNNFMCPPYVGTLEEFEDKVKEYTKGFLVLVKDKIDDPSDHNAFYVSADQLHGIMLDIESYGKKLGFDQSFAFIGGHCRLCKICAVRLGKEKCIDSKRARPSLEAVGVDVIDTCSKVGIHIAFKKDEVTWVGCLLI